MPRPALGLHLGEHPSERGVLREARSGRLGAGGQGESDARGVVAGAAYGLQALEAFLAVSEAAEVGHGERVGGVGLRQGFAPFEVREHRAVLQGLYVAPGVV
jgi:hypothetical protein